MLDCGRVGRHRSANKMRSTRTCVAEILRTRKRVRMTEAGADSFGRPMPEEPLPWLRRGDTGFAWWFVLRKPIVARRGVRRCRCRSAAISLSRALIGDDRRANRQGPKYLLIAFLVLTFFAVGLYTGCGLAPMRIPCCARIGVVGFVRSNCWSRSRMASRPASCDRI